MNLLNLTYYVTIRKTNNIITFVCPRCVSYKKIRLLKETDLLMKFVRYGWGGGLNFSSLFIDLLKSRVGVQLIKYSDQPNF